MLRNLRLLKKDNDALNKENHELRHRIANIANMEAMEELAYYIQYPDQLDETWFGPSEDYMKLLACPICKDVIVLRADTWRMCHCGNSGGQYCPDNVTAVVGGEASVLGIQTQLCRMNF